MLTRRQPAPFEYLKIKQGKKGITATIRTHKKNVSEEVMERRRIEARILARMEAVEIAEIRKQQKRAKGFSKVFGKLNKEQITDLTRLSKEQSELLGKLSADYNAGRKFTNKELAPVKSALISLATRLNESIKYRTEVVKTLKGDEAKASREYVLHLVGARAKLLNKITTFEETQFFPKGFVAEVKVLAGMKPSK